MTKLTLNAAANELDSIRNARHDYDANNVELLARVDEIGHQLAKQRMSLKLMNLLTECGRLADLLQGGSGKGGVRLHVVAE